MAWVPRSWRAIFFWPMILAFARVSSSSVRPSARKAAAREELLLDEVRPFRAVPT